MNFTKVNEILDKNKKCKQCGETNKSKNWICEIKNEMVKFECKKCGFKLEVK